MNECNRQETLLIQRAILGDNQAFGQLIQLHQSRVRGFLQRLCRDTASADDLAQDTFVIAGRKLNSYRGAGSFNGWLCSIAYRCFLQQQRSRKREQEITQQYSGEQDESARYHAVAPEHLDLERAIRRLDSREAAAITLNISQGFSHAEVASILELPLGTVKSLINRGLPKLRALLETETEDGK